jgi:hypothetical protein
MTAWVSISPTRTDRRYGALAADGVHGEILLRLRVGVPAAWVDEFLPRLQLALESMVREVVGPDVSATFAVEPAEESGTDT